MVRKVLVLSVSLILTIGSFAGCAPGKKPDEKGGTTATTAAVQSSTQAPEQKKYTVKWCGLPSSPVEKDTQVEKMLEELFNVDIQAVSIPQDYDNKLAAMIASGDIPDIIFSHEPQNWQPMAGQGILAEIPVDSIKKNAPNAAKLIDETDPRIWSISQYKGKNWAIPKVVGTEVNTVAVWRKDWLEKVGISKVPENLQEYEAAFVAFRNNDPDKNGKKDTYGFTGMGGHSVRQFDAIFGAYGIMPGQWRKVDGKIVMSTILPQAKDVLKLLNDWYKKELIDPEFITDNADTTRQKYEAGRLGLQFTAPFNYHSSMPNGKANLEAWSKRNPDAKFSLGPIPAGPDGKHGDWQWGPRGNFVVFGSQVGKEPDKMSRLLNIMDTVLSDEELAIKVVWGEKGRTYDFIDAQKGAAGGLKYLPPYDADPNARAKEGIGQFFQVLYPVYDWALPSITAKYMPQDYEDLINKNARWNEAHDILMRAYLPSAAQYQANLDKLKTTAYSEFIMGKRSFDDWDKFVKEWLDQGGQKLTEEAQAYYEQNMKPFEKQ